MNKNWTAAAAGAGMPFAVALLVGVTEPLFQNDYASWGLTILLCLAWVIGVLLAERRVICPEKPLRWGSVLMLSAVPAVMIVWYLVSWYIDDFYNKVNPWDDTFLSGLQWLIYLGTIICAYVLWLLIRVIIGLCAGKKNSGYNPVAQ